MIRGMHHPGIVVSDLERAKAFYTDVLEFEFLFEMYWDKSDNQLNQIIGLAESSARACVMKGSNCYLELFEYSAPLATTGESSLGANEPGIRHLCFEVDDAVAAYERLKAYDAKLVMNRPVEFQSGGSAVYCRDPFGNIIEFTTAGRGFPSLAEINKVSENIKLRIG